MSSMADRLKRAREQAVEIGGHTFVFRRPTDYQAALIYQNKLTQFDVAAQYVIGWKNVREIDLMPMDGGEQQVPFDSEVWAEWLADHQDWWVPIYTAIVGAYAKFKGIEGTESKNSQPGSSKGTSKGSTRKS